MFDRRIMEQPAQAVIFDLDGVITSTAALHAAAWKAMFDEFLERWGAAHEVPLAPFDVDVDYHLHVDGKLRQDGVRDFLVSRGIELPEGDPADPPGRETVWGLGNRKNDLYADQLASRGATVFPGTVSVVDQLAARGVPMAVVSASRNCRAVLRSVGLGSYFGAVVDGVDAEALALPGKPEPAAFLEAARRLGVPPEATVVIEDSIAGVEAGRRGGFGLVIGIDRHGQADALHDAGAEVVLGDLSGLDLETLGLVLHWQRIFEGFDPATEGQREALCTLGNGYLGTRGALPEADATGPFYPGTYISGVYDRVSPAGDGRETDTETIVNVPNWLALCFRIDGGDWFDVRSSMLLEQRHELDLRGATLVRHLRFRDAEGRVTAVTQRRFVSMADPHLAGLQSTFLPENWSGTLEVTSVLDGRVSNRNVERYAAYEPDHVTIVHESVEDDIALLEAETRQSRVRVVEAARTRVGRNGESPAFERAEVHEERRVGHHLTIPVSEGVHVTVEKIVAIYTSKDDATSEPAAAACAEVSHAPDFESLLARHRLAWHDHWRRAQIAIEDGDEDAQEVLDLHVFHLLQTVSENSIWLDVGVPARGLHGEGYRGHIFWDEAFIFPFLNLRFPELTRSLLLYRYRRLPAARQLARLEGCEGAMYPWQSGSDGRDVTPRRLINPRTGEWIPDNSHLQRHVGLAVAYNVWLYHQTTDDNEFMASYGAEMLIEISRFFASLARYSRMKDRWEIRGVMGPDEFHDGYPDRDEPGLDNNAYTNVLAAWVLGRTLEALDGLSSVDRERVMDRLQLRHEELAHWDEVSRRLFVPLQPDGVICQFEGYDALEEFDWEGYRARYGHIERLDLILDAEGDTPNRYKLSKQPDVVMLFYLLSADELQATFERLGYPFERDTIPRNLAYYQARTSNGSTLSRVVAAWVLARGDRRASWDHFKRALASDVEDIQGGTTREGIHLGAMAGTVDLIQRCYTGIEPREDVLWLCPQLPAELRSIRFEVHYRGHWIDVDVGRNRVRLATHPSPAAPIRIAYKETMIEMGAGETHEFELLTAPSAAVD